jgi:hypothetical protein
MPHPRRRSSLLLLLLLHAGKLRRRYRRRHRRHHVRMRRPVSWRHGQKARLLHDVHVTKHDSTRGRRCDILCGGIEGECGSRVARIREFRELIPQLCDVRVVLERIAARLHGDRRLFFREFFFRTTVTLFSG